MGHRFTYVVSPEEERENLTVEWFLRRHGYSRHIITGLKRTPVISGQNFKKRLSQSFASIAENRWKSKKLTFL